MINSAAELARLLRSEDTGDRRRVLAEPASLEVWEAVVDEYPDLAFAVAQNKAVPVAVLERLCSDTDPRVRAMVASKRKLPAHLQRRQMADNDEGVRIRLARNAKVSQDVLAHLAEDTAEFVREAARKGLTKNTA